MTLGDLINEYADGKKDAITTIRTLTAMFNPDFAIDVLALVNQITRVEQGDLDRDLFRDLYKPKTKDEQN